MPESTYITKSNVFSQFLINLKNVIDDRSNVPDPNDSTGRRKFVYTREPHYANTNFKGFPLIYFEGYGYDQGDKVNSNTKAMVRDKVSIVVMSQDKHSDNEGNPSGIETLNEISDSIVETLNDLTISATLRRYGMKNKSFPSADFDPIEVNGKSVYKRAFDLRFGPTLRVIA